MPSTGHRTIALTDFRQQLRSEQLQAKQLQVECRRDLLLDEDGVASWFRLVVPTECLKLVSTSRVYSPAILEVIVMLEKSTVEFVFADARGCATPLF
jgi:hypothetical protein